MEIKKILILSIFAIAIAGIIAPASAAIDSADNNKVLSIESKEKTVTNKITWNANGGKIGSKSTIATTVKKDSKIGKLPTTPKRSGYTFSGWYTKKTGGSKITVNTKPTKAVSYFAQWKKADKKKFNAVGKWKYTDPKIFHKELTFYSNGSYNYTGIIDNWGNIAEFKGNYRVTGDRIITSNSYWRTSIGSNQPWEKNEGYNYQFSSNDKITDGLYIYKRV